jgi:tricarballylate dehydrogenase
VSVLAASQHDARGAPPWATRPWDVVVVGGGNAAIVSALTAADLGADVLLLERAPKHMRGGNTRHTRNIRCAHGPSPYNSGVYPSDELWRDLCSVGSGPNNEALARFTVTDSETIPDWMERHGARWQQPLSGTLHLGRTNRFFLGGGKALLNSYYRFAAAKPRITAVCDASVDELEFAGSSCAAVLVKHEQATHRVAARAVVCASGGFEANLDWLRRYWGAAVDNYVIRGTPYNDGHVLALLYGAGAASAGEERGFHAIALDARAPRFDGGIATRLDVVPFGIVVDRHGQRFYDEGEDFWPKRYAIWGTKIATQDDQIAYALWDAKVNDCFLPPMYGPANANDIGGLARELGLDAEVLIGTVAQYNAAVVHGHFDPGLLDECHTVGLSPPKTHWAQRLDTPPYFGIAMRPGVTFTYMGVAIDHDARVVLKDGTSFANVFAAGEIMSGNILSTGYLGGFGMTIGSVWGRRAGQGAAAHVAG